MIQLFSIFFFHLAFSDLYCILILYAIQMFEIIIYEKKMHSKITVSSNKNEIKMNHVTNVLKMYPFDTAMTTHKTHNTDFTIRYVLICVKSAWQIITYIQFYELMFTESSQRITKCVVLQLAVFKQFIANNSILNLTSLYRLNTTICNVTQYLRYS